jgi:hypothetical protein
MKSILVPSALLCLLSLYYACFSENARTEAMGGVTIINDFGHVLAHPASINDFPDQFTGTSGAYTDTGGIQLGYLGPIIGKKSLGKTVNVGFIANTVNEQGSSVLRSGFYNTARSFLIEHSGDSLPESFPMLPHAIVGLDFGDVSIGGEFYYEHSGFKRTVANSLKHTDLGISNFGGVLSATISISDLWLCPLIGFGAPTIKGEKQDSALLSFQSIKSNYLTGGAEAGIELPSVTLVAGAYYTNERYAFKSGSAASPDYSATIVDLYAGFTTYSLDSMLIAVQYDASLYYDDITDTSFRPSYEYHDGYGYHGIRLGVEKPFHVTGLFDAITPRAGLAYSFSLAREQHSDTTVHFPMSTNDMMVNAGIGFRKNVFSLDLFVNLGAWNGVLTGPQAMSATLTVGLSKDFLGKSL